MASALPYQISHGTVGVPLVIPTKSGSRCGHYAAVTTPTGKAGYRFIRDPNSICGLPTAKPNVAGCTANPSSCATVPLPSGWSQVGTQAVTGWTRAGSQETYGNAQVH